VSDHYEVVLTCFLRDDTPPPVLAALRWYLELTDERPPGLDAAEHPYPLLAPDPDSRLPGGESASLHRQSCGFAPDGAELHSWGLFSRTYWLDDDLGDLITVLDLIAPHVEAPHIEEPGYGGYVREEFDTAPAVITFKDGTYGPLKF
jgi:hypothetical protein